MSELPVLEPPTAGDYFLALVVYGLLAALLVSAFLAWVFRDRSGNRQDRSCSMQRVAMRPFTDEEEAREQWPPLEQLAEKWELAAKIRGEHWNPDIAWARVRCADELRRALGDEKP